MAQLLLAASGVWNIYGQTTLRVDSIISGAVGVGFEKMGSGVVDLNGSNLHNGDTVLTAGTVRLGNALALQNSTVNIGGGTLDVTSNAIDAIVGGLSGSGNLDIGSTNFTTGNNNTNTTYSGAITGDSGSSFTHDGTRRLTLTGTGHSLSELRVLDGSMLIQNGTMDFQFDSGESALVCEGSLVKLNSGAVMTLPSEASFAEDGGKGFIYLGGQLTVQGSGTKLEAGRLDFSAFAEDNTSSLLIENSGRIDVNLGSDPVLVFALSNIQYVVSASATIRTGGDLNADRIISGVFTDDTASFNVTGSGSTLTSIRFDMGGQSTIGDDDGETSLLVQDSASATVGLLNIWSTISSVTVEGGSLVVGKLNTHGLLPSISITDSTLPNSPPALTIGNDTDDTTIVTPIVDSSGPGSLTKVGNSALTLYVASTYSGDTVVEGGSLLLDVPASDGSPTGLGNIIIKNGSFLGGVGSIPGDLEVDSSGGTVTPALFGTTTLVVDNLTLSPAATLNMDLDSTDHDKISVGLNASLDGTLNVDTLPGFTAVPGDEFVVVDAGSSLTGEFDTVNYPDAQNWVIEYDVVAGTVTVGICLDADGDLVCDDDDICPGFDDTLDADGDLVPDGCDACPLDNPDDTDGDGVCDSNDPCPLDNPDDTDDDGVCDSNDPCPLDNPDDTDDDGVCDSVDICSGFDDTLDADGDGVPDDCDDCPDVNVQNVTQGTFHPTIQDAITAANMGDVIELGACTFFEDNIVFPNGVDVTLRGAGRDLTIIDGGGGTDTNPILEMENTGQTAATVISDLTLRNGVNSGSNGSNGGALWIVNTSPVFRNVSFLDNGATGFVGLGAAHAAIGSASESPVFDRCIFAGGFDATEGVYVGAGTASMVNCLFADNAVARALRVDGAGTVQVTNCTFDASNIAMKTNGGTINGFNSVFVGPLQFQSGGVINTTRCLYAGATGNNIDGLATFVDAPNGDYRLAGGSLGIDGADHDAYVAADGGATDLNGDPRTHDDTGTPDTGSGPPAYLDMGAFEFQGTTIPGNCDGDHDVDLDDYADFEACLSGPNGGVGAGCQCLDFDADGDVDLKDHAAFQLNFSGN